MLSMRSNVPARLDPRPPRHPHIWWAPGATRLFPHLDGDLEFAPLGARTSQITLMGSYDPPLGFVGRRADVLLLHRIAEASIRSFLIRVSRNLERPALALAGPVSARSALQMGLLRHGPYGSNAVSVDPLQRERAAKAASAF
ncbi:MAG: hypothetical protein WAL84_05920 [Candidatus Dormiibacterota bacterium]